MTRREPAAKLPDLPRWRLLLLVVLLAAATYANALGNGWALDDQFIVAENPVVTEARWGEAFAGAYWQGIEMRPALWRPTTLIVLTAERRLFGDRPAAFHAVSLLLHVLVSVLVAALIACLLPWPVAAAGAALFAVHPVHVEAVANVVGQSELLAAAAYVGACLLYLKVRGAAPAVRAAGLAGLALLYALALGAKEIAVTLPGVLALMALLVPPPAGGPQRRPLARLVAEAPLLLVLCAVAAAYLTLRVWVLGAVAGENIATELVGLGLGARALTALALWPTWMRLLLFPVDLAADYGPGVLHPATGLRADVVLGAGIVLALAVIAARTRRSAPWAALAAGWLALTVLPVSHLLAPAGTLLAERTLYLPSVAVALAAGGAVALAVGVGRDSPPVPGRLRAAGAVLGIVVAALLVRSVLRNPSWLDSYSVMNTLALEHPESWRAQRGRATGLIRAGDVEGALAAFEEALALLPGEYALLCEAGGLYKRHGRLDRAERLLAAATRVAPDRPLAYRLLGEVYLLAGDGRSAHRTALAGLARWGADHDLFAVLSESYVAKGDLAAAVRAREAALAADPSFPRDRTRLAELLDAQTRTPSPGAVP